MFKSVAMIALFGLLFGASGQHTPSPDVPGNLKAPASEEVILLAHATGFQVYACQPGADQKLAWVLKGPEADLHDANGAIIGRHFAGPTWKHNDGSEVTGKVVAKADAPEPDSIAWLLLNGTGHSGSGIFSRVTSIQRIHTKGGLAPQPNSCDASKQGTESKSPYSADYYFYAPAN